MQPLQPNIIAGYNQGGLVRDKKPFLLPDQAFARLNNAYVWRDRVRKREGLEVLDRLRRVFVGLSLGPAQASPWSTNILTITGLVTAANNANPGVVTTLNPHGLSNGDTVVFTDIVGATGYNNTVFTITVLTSTTFSVGVNAGAFGAYVSGGQWISNRSRLTSEPNSSIEPGTVYFSIGAAVLTDYSKAGTVIAATNANPCAVTTGAPHLLTTGDTITFAGVGGMTELNSGSYQITVTSSTTFTLNNLNSIAFPAYTVGGTWTVNPAIGNGFLTSTTAGYSATINYETGAMVITLPGGGVGAATLLDFYYFPGLPVMGIWERELGTINNEQTIFWDTKYNYVDAGSGFQQWNNTEWAGTDADFFGVANYRGINPYDRLFFETNFVCNAANPMRYYDGIWKDFAPYTVYTGVAATDFKIYSARILIPYYGRLVALNVWEGTDAGGYAGAQNYFNRCRFSQVGSPVEAAAVGPPATGAWRSDVFGKGGFIDAPTNEAIVSAQFFKNTLIVQFERSTWNLRYVGEYGLPFIWERISSDFGSESTFSTVLFDGGVLAVGDRAIVSSESLSVNRIDEQIPDQVFEFNNLQNGPQRIIGFRDFQKELVYWCYSDGALNRKFPNYTLLYNYKNNTYANFRNNITFYGTYQDPNGITWDSLTTFWDDNDVLWDDDPDLIPLFPSTVSGNQQGYIHRYGYTSFDEPSLDIKGVTIPAGLTAISLNVVNHNLEAGDIIYLTGLNFSQSSAPIATDLNDRIFIVASRTDDNNFTIKEWDEVNQVYIENYVRTPTNAATYVGGGQVTLFPRMYIEMKDFNPYAAQANQVKISYIDFLTDVPVDDPNISVAMSINIFVNTSLAFQGNTLVSNRSGSTTLTAPYYVPASDYVWHRFYATLTGQFLRIAMTYNDTLMNDINTHKYEWVLNAMTIYSRSGGKTIF